MITDIMQLPGAQYMSFAQREMHGNMIAYARERIERNRIHLLRKFFDIRRLKVVTFMGSFSWSAPEIKTKWLYEPAVSNYGGGYVTPADLARDYLSIKYANRKINCTSDQWRNCVADRRQPPIVSMPGIYQNTSYLDLSGAFWQIIRAVGWDVNYNPGELLQSNSRMTDFPYPQNKIARNCLVSIGLPTPLRFWDGANGKFKTRNRNSRFVNLVAWRLVMDVLNGVAWDMVKLGAVYVYTDGYILADDRIDQAYDILNSWGLQAKIQHNGNVHIVAPTNYCFTGGRDGDHMTGSYRDTMRRKIQPIPMMKVYDPGNSWLRSRFARFAKMAIDEWAWLNIVSQTQRENNNERT